MSAGNTSYSIPTLPSRVGMRDCYLMSLFSLGEATKKVRKSSPVHVFILTHPKHFVKYHILQQGLYRNLLSPVIIHNSDNNCDSLSGVWYL